MASEDFEKFAETMARQRARENGWASSMFDVLKDQIEDFEHDLGPDEETAVSLASFGQSVTVRVQTIGYRNPHLLVLTGETNDGRRVELLQHVSQMSLLLVAVPAKEKNAPRRIGFTM